MNCTATQTLLTLYLLKDLDEATVTTVQAHIERCADCRAALQDIDATLGLLRTALAAPTTAPARLDATQRARILYPRFAPSPAAIKGDSWFTRHHRGLAAAAALLFVCGIIGLLMPTVSSSRYRALRTQAMVMEYTEEVTEAGQLLEEAVDDYAAADMLEARDDADGVIANGGLTDTRPETKVTYYGFRAKKPGFSVGRHSPRSDQRVHLGLDLAEPELDSADAPRDRVAPEKKIAEAKGDALEYQRLHDIARAEAGSEMAGRYLKALDERRSQITTELEQIEALPPATEGADDTFVTGSGLPTGASGLTKGADKTDQDRHRALTAQLSTIEAAAQKWQAKSLLTSQRKADYSRLADAGLPRAVRETETPPPAAPLPTAEPMGPPDVEGTVAARDDVSLPGEVELLSHTIQSSHEELLAGIPSSPELSSSDLFDRVAMTKSPVVMRGILGRGVAARSGWVKGNLDSIGAERNDIIEVDVSFDGDAKEGETEETSPSSLKYGVADEGDVAIAPKYQPDGNMSIRVYDVEPALKQRLEAEQRKQSNKIAGDFIAIEPDDRLSEGEEFKALFIEMGVEWPNTSSVKYVPTLGKLVVANTAKNLDAFEDGLQELTEEERLNRAAEAEANRARQVAAETAKREKQEALEEEERLRFTAHGVNPFVEAALEAFSTFGIDVDTASYTLTRSRMAQGTLPPAEAVRTEEFVNAFDYDYVAPSHRTFRIYTELAPSPFGRGLQMLKIGVKGRRLGREEQRPAVLTFLVDTSGSMNAPDRIGLVQTSLKLLVEHLAPHDHVALIQYDSHAHLLLEHTPASQKARILQAIDRMQCTGSTNLEEGMNDAYRLAANGFIAGAENRVLLLSDGVANLGNTAAEDILKKVAAYRKQGIFCSVFGVGSGRYDDTMLETLANKGDGVYTFLDSEEQARRVFVDDLAATLNTIASDVKIQVEFNPEVVKQYRQLGYENRRLRKEDFRNDAVDAGEVGSGQAVTALYELVPQPQRLASQQIAMPPQKLATVRVRYRRIDNGRVEEIERAVWRRDCVPSVRKATNGFRLAAAVAEFAELLRGSPYAKGSRYADVADLLRPIALELHLDSRVQELLQMVMAAESTPRGE
ncbi:MAG: von Willebrand factor type A domain-containing protein [Lentisphaerae bacterium]|nr:von Willebrand factor type A domain-containing protein [Lentisphaerota bacterium]